MLETLTVAAAFTPLDLLLFRRFGQEVPGLLEDTLARNPHLAELGAFLPIGAKVLVAPPAPITRRAPTRAIRLYE